MLLLSNWIKVEKKDFNKLETTKSDKRLTEQFY